MEDFSGHIAHCQRSSIFCHSKRGKLRLSLDLDLVGLSLVFSGPVCKISNNERLVLSVRYHVGV